MAKTAFAEDDDALVRIAKALEEIARKQNAPYIPYPVYPQAPWQSPYQNTPYIPTWDPFPNTICSSNTLNRSDEPRNYTVTMTTGSNSSSMSTTS